MKKCSVTACQKPVASKGYCWSHYHRARRYGDPETIKYGHAEKAIEAALQSNTDDCILWAFGSFSEGYGAYKSTSAHREICRRAHGEPTEDKPFAAHKCGNRRCVNPRHLRWATPKENSEDMVRHVSHPIGESRHNAKLTNEAVGLIKRQLAEGRTMSSIAKEQGMSVSAIRQIRVGKTWRHIAPA